MAKRDYYDALGVSRSATADEIKTAYRKLARKLHPDVNKAPDAQARFTEVQNAYDALSDPQKRKAYDQFGEAGVSGSGAAAAAAANAAGGGAGPHFRWSSAGGPGVSSQEFDAEELGSMFEAFFGGQQGFGSVGGPGGRSGRSSRSRPQGRARHSEPLTHDLNVTFMTAAMGGTEKLRLSDGEKTRTIEVKIPPGVSEGAHLRVKGAAPEGADLILTIHVGEHPLFRRSLPGEGTQYDLVLDLPLTIGEATLGTTLTVPTLEGSVELKIPPGTSSGRKLRLRGRGIRPQSGEPGDLYVIAKVVVPDPSTLDDSEKETLRKISERQPNPRSGPMWSAKT
jgi:curved DNA-binding protein